MPIRRFPRYSVNRPVNVKVYWDDIAVRTLHGRCLVLGEGGLGARISDQLYIGDVVRLELPPLVQTYGSVRNVRGPEHGFQFLFIDEGQRRAVKRLLETCAQEVQPTEPPKHTNFFPPRRRRRKFDLKF